MPKVFAFVGSGAGEKSHTVEYVRRILSEVAGKVTSLEYEIFTPANTRVEGCKSCNQCFIEGICHLDESDDMKMLKRKMLDADFIILGSPVFAHHVSSDTKCLIDRISYWIKVFALGGKMGMAVSTTSNNGHETVITYLADIMKHLGVNVIIKDNVAQHEPNEFYDPVLMEKKVRQHSDLIAAALCKQISIKPDPLLNRYFLQCKTEATLSEYVGTFHYQFWRDNGFFSYSSYENLMEKGGVEDERNLCAQT